MYYFATIADKNYLAKGLALYESLMKVNDNFVLFWGCLDEETYQEVRAKIGITAFKLYNLYPPEGKHKDYCFKMQTYFTWWVTEKMEVDHICYLDSDMYFYQDYAPLFNFTEGVGLISHNIDNRSPNVGEFNSGLVYFRDFHQLERWKDMTLSGEPKEYATCHDQKFLELLENTHVIDCGHGAWWNNRFYEYKEHMNKDIQIVWNGKIQWLCFMHYSNTQLTEDSYTTEEFQEPTGILKTLYDDYVTHIRGITARLAGVC